MAKQAKVQTIGQKIEAETAKIVEMYRWFENNPIEGVSSDIAFLDAHNAIYVAEMAIENAKKELNLD